MFNDRLKQLGEQYLLRTREELLLLHAELAPARTGDAEALLAMQRIAHRISGSGAMLGFKAISDCAAQIERILRRAEGVPNDAEWQVIVVQLQRMAAEVNSTPPAADVDA